MEVAAAAGSTLLIGPPVTVGVAAGPTAPMGLLAAFVGSEAAAVHQRQDSEEP